MKKMMWMLVVAGCAEGPPQTSEQSFGAGTTGQLSLRDTDMGNEPRVPACLLKYLKFENSRCDTDPEVFGHDWCIDWSGGTMLREIYIDAPHELDGCYVDPPAASVKHVDIDCATVTCSEGEQPSGMCKSVDMPCDGETKQVGYCECVPIPPPIMGYRETDDHVDPLSPGCIMSFTNNTCVEDPKNVTWDTCADATNLEEATLDGIEPAMACVGNNADWWKEPVECATVQCPQGQVASGQCKTLRASCAGDEELDLGYCECVAAPPPMWASTQVGTANQAGSVSESSGVATVAGAGVLTGYADTFQFASQTLDGDGEIIARVTALQNTGDSARVGVMIRETLSASSRHVFLGMTGAGGVRWVRRTGNGGSTSTSSSGSYVVPDAWFRLVRVGNTITSYKSSNGTTWVQLGSLTATLPATMYAGLAVASGSNAALNTSQFASVTFVP